MRPRPPLDRDGFYALQIERGLARLTERLDAAAAFAVRFRRGTSRAFFVLAQERHAEVLRERIEALRTPARVRLRPMTS